MTSKFLVLQNKDQFSCISGIRFGTVSVTDFLSLFPVSDSLIPFCRNLILVIYQKKNENDKNKFFEEKHKKAICKHKVGFLTLSLPPLNRGVTCSNSKLRAPPLFYY